MFDFRPTLEDELVLVRPLTPDDFEALYVAASDPLIWEQHPSSDRSKHGIFTEFFRGAIDSGGAFTFIDKATGEVIGTSRFIRVKESENAIEIGWTFLARKYWGGVYNGAIKTLMLNHAYGFVDNVIFNIGENNLRSRKAVEKLGGSLITELYGISITPPADARVTYLLTKEYWQTSR